jgi:hypothetical protein
MSSAEISFAAVHAASEKCSIVATPAAQVTFMYAGATAGLLAARA